MTTTSDHSRNSPDKPWALRACGVCKSMNGNSILYDIDLNVRHGEVVCIVGPSGSGKSTLLRCLNWLSPPDSGEIRLGRELLGQSKMAGGQIVPLPERQIRKQRSRIGMVFQSFNLWPHMSACENVMEGLISVRRISKAQALEEATSAMEQVGLGQKLHSYPATLSGGQQQRVAIARALAMKPEVILLDEPTSALDPELVGEVLAVIKGLATEKTTMIIVTHEIHFAAEVADTIVFMDEGEVVEKGPAQDVLYSPKQARAEQFFARFVGKTSVHQIVNPEETS
jgi:polar amino acid transport system ATP-binding protein